jgi:hypothetical protein
LTKEDRCLALTEVMFDAKLEAGPFYFSLDPMTYCVSIGVNTKNKSNIGQRGWQIARRGRTVLVTWGPILIKQRPKRYVWVTKRTMEILFKTTRSAQQGIETALHAASRTTEN